MRGLYAIIDTQACRPSFADPLRLAEEVLDGGCAVLQLRSKDLDDAAYVALAAPMAELCRRAGVPFIVNDRVHLVRSIRADGVHLGQSDMAPDKARQLVGQVLLGVSTHSVAQAKVAAEQGVDWVAFGPINPTRTKADAEPAVGLPALQTLCSAIASPVIAIGGLDLESARQAIDAGASMVALISALAQSVDPRSTTAQFQSLFHTA